MDLRIYDYDNYDKDTAAQLIYKVLQPYLTQIDGFWLYREPEYKTEGNDLPTFTILSLELGLVFIKVFSENNDSLTFIDKKFWIIDNIKTKSGFQKFRNYVHRIKSKIEDPMIEFTNNITLKTIYVFPYISNDVLKQASIKDNEIIYDDNSFRNLSIPKLKKNINDNDYSLLVSIIQNANIINKFSNIYVEKPAKNMFEAIELNNKKIASFDYDQMAASLTITDKSERIRGLAGSGKTVLLAMKAARLHKRFPEKKIAFIFYTKSLYNQATNLIRKYYNQVADDEPNWDNLKVLHSWGGVYAGEGFYSYVCKEHGIKPKTYSQGSLAIHCRELIENIELKQLFDYILIDEAQDFPLDFFLLVEKIAYSPKKIVIAYDELQTTSDITIPQFEELFGKTNDKPNIILEPKYDYILKKSYRNTLEVLIAAFAFGFGFYHNITQIIQDPTTWDALGFECKTDLLPGKEVTIHRPLKNSPNSITEYFKEQVPISYAIYMTTEESFNDIVNKIENIIKIQKVKATDILIIDINMNKDKALNLLQYKLQEKGIESHIPGLVSDARDFFVDGKITLTTPRNAKGNEVPIVFVVGCEEIYSKTGINNQRQVRNFMFISITRSKGWVYLYAVGRIKGAFHDEFRKIQKFSPDLTFIYPEDDKIAELTKINFLTNNPVAMQLDNNLSDIKKVIERGNETVLKQLLDLDPSLKASLKKLLREE